MKKVSAVLMLSMMLTMFTGISAFASDVTKIETEQGGYVTLTNIVQTQELIQDDPQGSDTAYLSDGPVTLTLVGDVPQSTIHYYADGDIVDGFFEPTGDRESVEVVNNRVTLSESGYYTGFAYFGGDFMYSSTAAFVIQVNVEGQADAAADANDDANPEREVEMSEIHLVSQDSGFSMYVPNFKKIQQVSGTHEESGDFAISGLLLGAPEFVEGSEILLFEVATSHPEAYRAHVEVNYFGSGQLRYVDTEFVDGKIPFYMDVGQFGFNQALIEEHLLTFNMYAYDIDGEFIVGVENVVLIYEGHKRYLEERNTTAMAKPTASKVLVDGQDVAFQAYNIEGNNYFKLRDLAMALNNSEASFEVDWDGQNNAILLETDRTYTAVGGELAVEAELVNEHAKLSTSTVYLNGQPVELTAYLINGNNYFKLRDVAAVINFGVTWDGATSTIGIDSSMEYVEE